ncbi:MAG: hypothetical protein ACU0GG_03295 [Paracoccaceae bacterium]
MDLFTPKVPEHRLHPNFLKTLADDSSGVRKVLTEWAEGFSDRDGKFVKEFQTTYNSSFWELYLHAVFKEMGIGLDFAFSSPDFLLPELPLVVEATTANNSIDDAPEWEKTFDSTIDPEIFLSYATTAIRNSNSIQSKSAKYIKSYASLDHVKERPFAIAVASFATHDHFLTGDVPMQWLLYDPLKLGHLTKSNGSKVKLGIFNDDELSHVSAVFYSSTATFGKARALGNDKGDYLFNAVRIKNNIYPIRIVAKKDEYEESLSDGLRVFCNPYAEHPIDLAPFEENIGIRIFDARKDGTWYVTCHPEGDLCMRMVTRLVYDDNG